MNDLKRGTRAAYAAEQQNDARQSGTTKGKRAVRYFLRAVAERFSDGIPEGDMWTTGIPALRMQAVNNLFWKWVMEMPPWGSPAYNAVVMTAVFSPQMVTPSRLGFRYQGTISNIMGETEQDILYKWVVARLMRMEMRDLARTMRWHYFRRVFRRLFGRKAKT